MYNDILDAVTRRLNELFGDDYEIYTDPVKQGIDGTLFFCAEFWSLQRSL